MTIYDSASFFVSDMSIFTFRIYPYSVCHKGAEKNVFFFFADKKIILTFAPPLRKTILKRNFGEVAEWSIAAVLKTVVPRGTRGSNPCLSAINAENQQIAKQIPSFTPKNVKSGVFVLFKIIQPLHNKRVAILKESDEKRLILSIHSV